MRKILIISTVSRQFYLFEQGNIEVLHSLGYKVHAAANFSDANNRLDALDIISHHFDIQRSPFSLTNIKAYKQLKQIMKSENFDAVHCHSPMGGVLARLAAKEIGISPVIYTAHGFHFYEGVPFINWLVYYPVEKFLAKYTDVLITINQEDYNRAKNFKTKRAVYVPGVGVDTKKFDLYSVDRDKKRKELDVARAAFIVLSVGELNKNKNHEAIIKAMAKVSNPNVLYLICGRGSREVYLKQLAASHGIAERVKFLGFRNDIIEIYKVSDMFVLPSYREGLSVSLMEAMSAALPCVVSNIRGNMDLIEDGKGGYCCDPYDVEGFAIAIKNLSDDIERRNKMGLYNMRVVANYDIENVKNEMLKIYTEVLSNE